MKYILYIISKEILKFNFLLIWRNGKIEMRKKIYIYKIYLKKKSKKYLYIYYFKNLWFRNINLI